MDYVNFRPRAKINVSLDVLGKLDNGYHEVRMIMQTLKLHDDLFIKKTDDGLIQLRTNHPNVPTDEKNLVYAACNLVMKEWDIESGLYIELFKRIPVAAGLGGGSSDAAAALRAMRKLFGFHISDGELAEMSLGLGADVPFFIRGGTALAQGIGDELSPLPKHPYIHVLICKPDFNVSTAAVYKQLDISKIKRRPDTDRIIAGITNGNISEITANMSNVLESVTQEAYPVIKEIKAAMIKKGAVQAMMSGSGPTVFGYFVRRQDALSAGCALYDMLGTRGTIYLTGTL